MRRQERQLRRENARFFSLLVLFALAAALAGLLVLPGRVASPPPIVREPMPLSIDTADQRFRSQYEALAGRTDRASRLQAAQLLALWGNDTNRQLEKGQQAEQIARDLVRDLPDDPEAWSTLGYALEIQARYDEARAAYARGRELAPQSAELAFHVAHVNALEGNDAAARSTLREALAYEPTHAQALTLQGYYDLLDRDIDGAIARFDRAAASAPNARTRAEALVDLSAGWLVKGDAARAQGAADRALAADSAYSSAWIARARALLLRNDRAGARHDALQALALYPAHSHAHIVLAQVALREGGLRAAADEFRAARATLGEDNTVLGEAKRPLYALLYLEEARAATRAGERERAVAVLAEGMREYPASIGFPLAREAASGTSPFSALRGDPAFDELLRSVEAVR